MMDVMIDIETLGTSHSAVVLSIGAVKFDENKILSEFYCVLDKNEQTTRSQDISTLQWWAMQADEVRLALDKPTHTLKEALQELTNFLKTTEDRLYVWGNGSNFDICILENLYEYIHAPIPWKYRNVMDLRTFKRFVMPNYVMLATNEQKHNALQDAKHQALFVISKLQELAKVTRQ